MSRKFNLFTLIYPLFFMVNAEKWERKLDSSNTPLRSGENFPSVFGNASRRPEGPEQGTHLERPLDYCNEFPMIQNAEVKIQTLGTSTTKVAHISCYDGFALYGSSDIFCVFGQWEFNESPKCEMSCPPPPYLENGDITLSNVLPNKKTKSIALSNGKYRKGTAATYSCRGEFDLVPLNSRVRVCEGGRWSGRDAYCKKVNRGGCLVPKPIENGFMNSPEFGVASEGFPVKFGCKDGFHMRGSPTSWCNNMGKWDPEPPVCEKEDEPYPELASCKTHPFLENPTTLEQYTFTPVGGPEVVVGCKEGYRNSLAPCQTTTIYCKYGNWLGNYPQCVPAVECATPPEVPFALIVQHSYDYDAGVAKFPLYSKITYECVKGYILEGNPKLKCSASGCWVPQTRPRCVRLVDNYLLDYNKNAILISSATGTCVLTILLAACLVVACKKRRVLARAVGINASPAASRPLPPDVVNDHAVLLQQTDRLALIAFTEGLTNNQANINALPTYEEALRLERGRINPYGNPAGGIQTAVLTEPCQTHGPRTYWPPVNHIHPPMVRNGSGRSRSATEGTGPQVVRMGYCISHTPSTRSASGVSAGDSMGSTDTMALSEGSTNVTLDTASSYSGQSAASQNPSCRVHCGSLASFDACSANHEDIPLLEESELEDCQIGSSQNDVRNPSLGADNISSKLSTNSAPINV